MKLMRNTKKAISLLLAVLLATAAFSAAVVTFGAVSATISYSFTGSGAARAGYAQGTITLNAPAGTYWLYWADDNSALDGYYKLAKLTVGSSGSATHTMYAQTAIPADATKLIAIQSTSEPAAKLVSSASAVYNIPSGKLLGYKTSQRNYRFASYSDVHIDALFRTYPYADVHWKKALNTAAAREADFMVLSGDYVNNNVDYASISDAEWHIYEKVLAESDYCNPIYEAIGNHELWQSPTNGTNDFILATGLDGSVSSASKGYFEKTLGGDHFIFMSMEGGFYPNQVEEFSTAQLDWLEGLLKKYSGDGKNIYIIEHSLFYGYGAGDRIGDPYYDIPLSDAQDSTVRFKNLLKTYKDTIFISGHTHIAFEYQYNYSDNNGTSAQMIHNSSVGGVRYIGSDGKLTRDYPEDVEEGFIVDVFDNAIIFNGTHLYYNMIDPNCCYIVKTSKEVHDGVVPTAPTGLTEPSTAVRASTAAPVTQTPTAAYNPDIPTTLSASSYYLKGSFNSWGSGNPLYNSSESGILSTTLNLAAGTYTFKINTGSSWYGNDGTIQDTTRATSQGGWEMTSSAGDCTLKASGGYYTFNFNTSNNKLTIIYSTSDPYYVEPTAAVPVTQAPTAAYNPDIPTTLSASSYYLKGSFNSWGSGNPLYNSSESGILSTTLNLAAGTYTFKINTGSSWYGNDGTIQDTTRATSQGGWEMTSSAGDCTLKASGGYYTFNFNTSNNKLTIIYSTSDPYYVEPTEAPTTVAPTTVAPTTAKPTAAPTTVAPTTAKPTAAPTTVAPTTVKPTAAPTTVAPTTVVPTTAQPFTYVTEPFELPEVTDPIPTAAPATAKPTSAPTTAAPTTAKPTAAPVTEAPTTEPPAPEYKLGDADEDGLITIKDATLIQKHIAKFKDIKFTEAQLLASDVNFDGIITIKDVTVIQKYIAHMINEFLPDSATSSVSKYVAAVGSGAVAAASDSIASVGESAVAAQAAEQLSLYYRYSSYDCYQALKKAYRSGTATDSQLTTLMYALNSVVDKTNVDTASRPVTVYFENTNNWSSVYAYVWGNGGVGNEKQWPGTAAVYVGKNEYGKSIYKHTVTSDKFTSIIFTDGTNQTDDLRIFDNNLCFYITGGSSPYYVHSYIFKDKYIVSK